MYWLNTLLICRTVCEYSMTHNHMLKNINGEQVGIGFPLILWPGEHSNTIAVGVPQGSILGPLLFTLYINDMPEILDESIHLYDDDGTLQVVHNDIRIIELKLTDAFAKIVNWMKLNKLTVHVGKTKVQLIASFKRVNKNTNVTVKYENQILEQVSSHKLLGIHIDSNFTLQDKYNYICKKISQNIGFLNQIRNYVNIDIHQNDS